VSPAVEARSPGCCAQRSGVSGVLSIHWRGAAAAARGADLNKVELPGLISFSRIGVRRRWSLRMDLALVGRVAAAAPEFRGRCVIAGLLRTAVGGLRRPLYPLARCRGSGPGRRIRGNKATSQPASRPRPSFVTEESDPNGTSTRRQLDYARTLR
jgi:hypothetical protein